jgi:hypothetical protein
MVQRCANGPRSVPGKSAYEKLPKNARNGRKCCLIVGIMSRKNMNKSGSRKKAAIIYGK